MKFIDITPLLGEMKNVNPVYEQGTIPAATYPSGVDVPTIVVPNVLLVRADLDANLACLLTRTLFERKEQLVQANASAKGIELTTAPQTAPVELHRGARKALDDLGAPK